MKKKLSKNNEKTENKEQIESIKKSFVQKLVEKMNEES